MQRTRADLPPNDWRLTVPRYSEENFPNIVKLSDGLAAIGKKYNATPGQITLAWLLAQGEDIIPIPGTTKIAVSALVVTGSDWIDLRAG